VLRSRDLGFDVVDATAQDGSAQTRHGLIHDVVAPLRNLGEQHDVARSNRSRDPRKHRLHLLGVLRLIKGTDQEPRCATDEHTERTAKDSYQEPDQAALGGRGELVVAGRVLDDDLAIFSTLHDRGPP
jgi:hypothetical protein